MEKKQTSQRTKNFLKKNVYYIIMAVCLLAIAAMVTVTVLINNGVIATGREDLNGDLNNGINDDVPTGGNTDTPTGGDGGNTNVGDNTDKGNQGETQKPDDSKQTDTKPIAIVFVNPVEKVNIIQDYCMDSLVWNSTLKHYAVHNGIDFAGEDGTNVMCVYDGVVTDISYDVLNGNMVTIKHNDNLYSTYSSLNEPVVKVGQTVNKGAVIGTMGTTATAEYSSGAHVHFSVTENGNLIDPKTYLTVSNEK